MAKRLIYVGQDDDVSDLAGKVQAVDADDEVALVVPAGAQAFQTPLNLRLLRSVAAKRGLTASVVTPDPRIQELTRTAGLPAYTSVAAYEGGVPIEARPAGQAPLRGMGPPQRPRAPFLPRPSEAAGFGGGAALQSGYALRTEASPLPGIPLDQGVRDAAVTFPEGAPPAPPPLPWGAAAGATESPELLSSPVPVSPAMPSARSGSMRTPLTDVPEWEEPVPPWAAARARLAFSPGAGSPVVAPPSPRSSAPPAPPGRVSGRSPSAAPGHGHSRLRERSALYFVLIALGVVGILAFLVLSPSATVTVTVAEQPLTVNPTIQGTSAAAQASQTNYVLSKVVTDSGTQQFQVTPTGSQAVSAVAATGSIVLTALQGGICYTAPGGCSAPLKQGTEFQTSGSPGVLFEVTQDTDIVVPPGGSPSPTISVTAVTAGTGGNVAAGAITQWVCDQSDPTCLQDEAALQVSNPQATTGGVDASTETVASASDIQSWQSQLNQVESQLSAKATSDMAAKFAGDRAAVDSNGGGRSVTYTVTPSSFVGLSAGTKMSSETVTVAMSAQETVYDPASVQADLLNDLKASTNLPAGDSLVPGALTLSNLQIIQAGSDGTFALSVTGVDYYRSAVNLGQLRDQLTGHNPGDVTGIIEQQIPDVENVTVHETPLQLFFMPFFSSHIHISETFVTPNHASSSTTG
jgi:hypothetical protein